MTANINEHVLHMLKEGKDPVAIQEFIAADNKKSYKPVFIDFMQDMIEKYHVKRTEIAEVTGISRDYLYKVLNGQKTTAERDYVIAICLGIGMNFPETQHALQINGMSILNTKDIRDYIIIHGISDKRSITRINIWLDEVGFPPLRISQDMEQYIPRIEYDGTASFETVMPKQHRHFKEIFREIDAEHCGDAPFDYMYWGNITVEDEESNRYYVQGFYSPVNTAFSVLDEENYQLRKKWLKDNSENQHDLEGTIPDGQIEETDAPWQMLEVYDEFEETYDSEFFRFFAEIDKATDEKVTEVLAKVDDTANYKFRANIQLSGEGIKKYAERYDSGHPELRQYFQIIETDDKTIYSASHESAYMRIELGSIYPAIFGEAEDIKYFFYEEVKKGEAVVIEDVRTRFMFNSLKAAMHDYLNHVVGEYKEIGTDEESLLHEKTETLANQGAWMAMHGDFEGSLEANLELYKTIKDKPNIDNFLAIMLSTIGKIRICYENLGDEEKASEWSKKALEYEEQVLAALDQGEPELDGAVATLSDVLFDIEREYYLQSDFIKAKEYAYRVIKLLEGHCDDVYRWGILFVVYVNLAYILDEENNSEEALQYYEKAEEITRREALETHPKYRRTVLSFYNNYAWVLWNRFENQEAIFYYGKAIELTENIMNKTGSDLIHELEHYSGTLLKLYRQIGRDKEAERLIRRVKKYGIEIE